MGERLLLLRVRGRVGLGPTLRQRGLRLGRRLEALPDPLPDSSSLDSSSLILMGGGGFLRLDFALSAFLDLRGGASGALIARRGSLDSLTARRGPLDSWDLLLGGRGLRVPIRGGVGGRGAPLLEGG
jgi:hypothetical protein